MAGYVLVVAILKYLVLEPAWSYNMDDVWGFAIMVAVPLAATFMYFLAVFSFGLAGDLAARQSIFPARMFTLPVTSAALAGWPMLYGAMAMAILWLSLRLFAVWPTGVEVPIIWPALAAAVMLAWTQVLTWMPYGLPGVRVIVAVLWLGAIDVAVMLAIEYNAPEPVMLAIFAPQLPLAYLAARSAVARARRGHVPDWRPAFARLAQITDVLPGRREHFSSPARAQLWFEWRRHGWSLPGMVAMVLPFELALLFAAGNTPALVFTILLGVLVTPPFLAAFVGATLSKANPHASDSYGVSPFVATRPSTSAALIAAKLKMTMWSTLAAWLLVLVAIPLALEWSDTLPLVTGSARRTAEAIGATRAIVILLLILAGFISSTWKQLVQSLFVGLSGREWVNRANVFLLLSFLVAVGPMAQWIIVHGGARIALWNALPWILAALVGVKTVGAGSVAIRLHHSRVLSDRALVIGAACWLVAVLALHGTLVWFVDTPLIPRYFLLLVAILAIPLARLSAAPLALAWNRHR